MSVNVGFIGCGAIAQTHLKNLSGIKNAKVIACCDALPQRAEAAADMVGGRAYTDYREMVGREKLDAAYVCVPPFAHGFEVDFAERGIHMFIEKPVALTLDAARRIERAIAKAGVVSSVGYMLRYLDTTNLAKRILEESGPIGLVNGSSIEPFWGPPDWWIKKDKGGGYIVECSTHTFDLARYLVGDVASVCGESDALLLTDVPGLDVDDVTIVTMRFKNNSIGVITNSCASMKTYYPAQGITVIAKKAVVDVRYGEGGIVSYFTRIYKGNEVKEIRSNVNPYLEEDIAFIESVKTGAISHIKSSYSDGLKTLAFTLAANEAFSRKQTVFLDHYMSEEP